MLIIIYSIHNDDAIMAVHHPSAHIM